MVLAVRLALVLAAALALVAPAAARIESFRAPRTSPPADLRPFLLRADEPRTRVFPRTPSFAWKPVRGARRYEFQLAKSEKFGEGAIFWSRARLRTPAVSIPIALPWMTGAPYAIYARVRAITDDGATRWSSPYGFNVRWSSLPESRSAPPGLVRWTPVDGATRYDVWFTDAEKVISTKTNTADQREYYTFHQSSSWTGTVHWRVRAVRTLYGSLPNRLP
ncbi:MAG: hypothetical protein M3M94_01495, partial [Actinomycetota bacterium]|nr:hypothetical protein [Actinomycetota bacterium]